MILPVWRNKWSRWVLGPGIPFVISPFTFTPSHRAFDQGVFINHCLVYVTQVMKKLITLIFTLKKRNFWLERIYWFLHDKMSAKYKEISYLLISENRASEDCSPTNSFPRFYFLSYFFPLGIHLYTVSINALDVWMIRHFS